MNYDKHYNQLIIRGKNRLLEGYCEKHHIIPKCIGGNDMNENIVKLTPEEHYLAHLLLVKIYPNENGLIYAVHLMGSLHNNKRYGWAKRKHTKMLSETLSGVNNPMYGKVGTMTGKIHTKDAILKMSQPRSEKAKVNMSKPTGTTSPNYGKRHTEQSKKK